MKPFLASLMSTGASGTTFVNALKKYLDTDGNGAEFKALDPFYSYMVGKNPVDNHYYVSMLSTGGPPNNRSTYMFKLHPYTLDVVEEYMIPSGNSNTYDSHPRATLDFDSSGNTYIVRERGKDTSTGTSDGHTTSILVYRTFIPGNLSSIFLLKEINGSFTYPYVTLKGSTMYIGARGGPGGNNGTFSVIKSTDLSTFVTNIVMDTGLGKEGRAYSSTAYAYDVSDGYLYKIVNVRKDTLAAFESVFFLKTLDGVNWQNFEETFTKDIVADGPINGSEMSSNLLIWDKGTDDYCINFEGGVVKNGVPRILISKSLRDPLNIVDNNCYQTYLELRLYTNDGSGWSYEDVSSILPEDYYVLWAREKVIQLSWDNLNDYIHVVDRTITGTPIYEYKSGDKFGTWTKKLLYDLSGNSYYGSSCFNSRSESDRLIATVDVQGEIDDLNDYANLNLIKP